MISIDTPSWYNQLHSSNFADPKNIRKNINFLARVIQQLSMEESKEFLVPVVADVRQALKTLTRLHNSPLGTRDISFLFSSIFHVRNTIKWSRRKLHKKGSDFTLKSLLSRKNDLVRQLLVSKRRHTETQNTISALMSQVTTLISEKKLAITKFQSVVKKSTNIQQRFSGSREQDYRCKLLDREKRNGLTYWRNCVSRSLYS